MLAPVSSLDTAIAGVRSVYQPIVELRSRRVLAHEALARGPEGTQYERPDLLFAAAAAAGRTVELDWACRTAALRGAVDAGIGAADSLFVNAEPVSLRVPCPEHLRAGHDRDAARVRLVFEITERELTADPAALLATVAAARANGWGIAIDDVGADPASLALMPFLHPDVIKLDMSLVQRPDHTTAGVVNAVRAQAERTGALILAEGIETEAHLQAALAMGATLGQGWMFGRPGRLVPGATGLPFTAPSAMDASSSPFEIVAAARPVERTTKALLLPTSRFIEQRAHAEPEPPVLLGAFQQAKFFTPDSSRRYAALAEFCAFVGVVAAGMEGSPIAGVRGASLAADDAVVGEWDVVVTTPHFAAALVARDLGDAGPDADRRFDFVVTYDRELVLAAARSLFARILPTDPTGR